MPRANDDAKAAPLQEYAGLLAITGGDALQARAYEKAAARRRRLPRRHRPPSTPSGLREIPERRRQVHRRQSRGSTLTTGRARPRRRSPRRHPARRPRTHRHPQPGPARSRLMLYDELGIASVDFATSPPPSAPNRLRKWSQRLRP
ncbi:hypothetical protein ACU686_35905 [Yinghuangia aomiensis]